MSVNEDYFIDLWDKKRLFRLENDRLKQKKYVYTSFPIINKPTIYAQATRGYLFFDVYSRYLRHNCFNVLSGFGYNDLANTAFIETKKNKNKVELDLEGLNKIHKDIKKIGIGFDSEKEIKTNSISYIKFVQEIFVFLYQNKKISLLNDEYFYYENLNKIYNSFEIIKENDKFKSIYSDDEVVLKQGEYLALNIEKYIKRVIIAIERLDIEDTYKEKLLNAFLPYEGLSLLLYSFDRTIELEVFLREPELLAGINFIVLNPRYIDIYKYVAEDELESVNSYLEHPSSSGVFSGITLHNPLNNDEIPLIISYKFTEDVHIGIPDYKDEDYQYAKNMDLNITEILDENYLINSDFLTGLKIKEARNKIISVFCEEDIGTIETRYDLSKIIINSKDEFGTIIPIFININNEEKQVANINNLPIYLSTKFKQVITNDDLLPDELKLVNGTLNSLFTTGLSSLYLKYYDPKISISFPFEVDYSLNQVNLMVVKEAEIFKEVLMPIVFNEIFKDILENDYLGEIKKVVIEANAFDENHSKIDKKNNNVIYIDDVIAKFSIDAYRLYMLNNQYINEEFNFSLNEIQAYQSFLISIKRLYNEEFKNSENNLKDSFVKLKQDITQYIENYDLKSASQLLINYYKEYLIDYKMNKEQALDYLIMLGIFAPFLAETIYQGLYSSGMTFILYESWPNI